MRDRAMLVTLFVIHGEAFAAGSRIRVTANDGKITKGELLSVREDALVVATKPYSEYSPQPLDSSKVAVIRFSDIKLVQVFGSSNRSGGMVLGFIGGLVVTGAILAAKSDGSTDLSESTTNTMVLIGGSILGAFVGGAAASSKSTDDITLIPNSPSEFLILKERARFPEVEPEDLQRFSSAKKF